MWAGTRPARVIAARLVALAAIAAMPFPDRIGAAHQTSERTIWDGVFTAAQASRGKQQYETACGYCHRDDLSGGGGDEPGASPPALKGSEFLAAWGNADLGKLIGYTSTTMPYLRPKLEPRVYRDIVSYLLQANGAPPGDKELAEDPDELKHIAIVPKAKD